MRIPKAESAKAGPAQAPVNCPCTASKHPFPLCQKSVSVRQSKFFSIHMKASKQIVTRQHQQHLTLILGAVLLVMPFAWQSHAFPIGSVTFKNDAPFQAATGVHSLTSSDGLFTVAGWADTNATVTANLYQWFWLLGVDSGTGNAALLDGQESMTLQYDNGVGASHIFFLYTGGSGGTSNLARITISGFLSDPGAYAITANAPRIFNLSYAGGALTFDYLWDGGSDYGQLLLANPAASAGQTLKITGTISPLGDATGWGAGLFSESSEEARGGPALQPQSVRNNSLNSYTTADGALTLKAYVDRNLTTSTNFGTYLDQCFGVYGGANSGAIDTDETVTLQFASGFGLSRLESIYSSGQVSISGFFSDPGFSDLAGGSSNATYASGVLSFYPVDGGHHVYYFTNRTASAGQVLRINADPSSGNYFAVAGIGYANVHTLLGPDIPNNITSTYTTADRLLTLNAYSDTPGSTPANIYENVDWFGIAGGANNEAIDGTESLNLQFPGGAGLTGLGTRYTSGQVIISGFASDPGFSDPSGQATSVNYSGGTLSYTFNQYRAPELVVAFTNLAASAGQTLSLHTDGNPGSQIALTRINYEPSAVTLSIVEVGKSIVLTWPAGTLQQSPSATGTYTNVVGATSPYTNTLSGTQSFFRIKVQ